MSSPVSDPSTSDPSIDSAGPADHSAEPVGADVGPRSTRVVIPADADDTWVRVALDAAEDKLGADGRAFFVGESVGITDWFVVTSGATGRQVRAIVDEVEEQVAKAGGPRPNRIEGKDTLSWVLMDYGSFVVHVFDAESREYYDLERLWRDMPELTR